MKKTLAAVAILGAFAASASADVTVYGNLDTGLMWQHADGADTFQMDHSFAETSLIGLKGSEKVSDNLTVGFKMESAIQADTGKEDSAKFTRETLLYFKTNVGEFGFGRTGSLGASTGSYAFLGSGNTGFGGGMGPVGDNGNIFLGKNSRLDNSITYKSPAMGGVTLFAQVATAGEGDNEYTHDVERAYGIGAQYAAGALKAGLVATVTDLAQETVIDVVDGADDALAVSGFVTYDFGCAKTFVAAQYFDGAKASAKDKFAGYEGYGVTAAVAVPAFGGTAKAIVGYSDAEGVVDATKEMKTVMLGANYVYPLSKQSGLYAAAGYVNKEYKDNTRDEVITGLAGVYHKF